MTKKRFKLVYPEPKLMVAFASAFCFTLWTIFKIADFFGFLPNPK